MRWMWLQKLSCPNMMNPRYFQRDKTIKCLSVLNYLFSSWLWTLLDSESYKEYLNLPETYFFTTCDWRTNWLTDWLTDCLVQVDKFLIVSGCRLLCLIPLIGWLHNWILLTIREYGTALKMLKSCLLGGSRPFLVFVWFRETFLWQFYYRENGLVLFTYQTWLTASQT